MGAVPESDQDLRRKQLAGPAASLLTGLVLLTLFYQLASIHWQGSWRIVAVNAALGFYYGIANLVPAGYSDGTMILHLARGTRRGQQLLELGVVNRQQEEAEACHGRACFEEEVAVRTAALRRLQATCPDHTIAIAFCHQRLGHALLAAEQWHQRKRSCAGAWRLSQSTPSNQRWR